MTNHQETTNCDIYREKGRSQKKRNATCNEKTAQLTELIEKIQNSQEPID